MFEKTYKTSYGLEFFLINAKEWKELKPLTYECQWTDFDRVMAGIQLKNCGYVILSKEYQTPIDNEYDLGEIYTFVENMKVK